MDRLLVDLVSHNFTFGFQKEHTLTQQEVVGVPLILEGKTTVTDMVEIFQPFEIRHCHTTSIDEQILIWTKKKAVVQIDNLICT